MQKGRGIHTRRLANGAGESLRVRCRTRLSGAHRTEDRCVKSRPDIAEKGGRKRGRGSTTSRLRDQKFPLGSLLEPKPGPLEKERGQAKQSARPRERHSLPPRSTAATRVRPSSWPSVCVCIAVVARGRG